MPAINNRPIQATQTRKQRGFILLPVVLAITLIAAIAYLMNVDGAMNVNSLGKEAESAQARFVAMAGMDQMLWQANKSSCTGYANLTNTAFGTDSYSATITPTSGSPVSISVTGNHASGASYSIKRDRVKVYKPSKTTTQKMGDKAADKDSTLDATKPTSNSGIGHVFVSATATGPQKNALLYFDVSSIPAGNKVISAQLELFPYYISSPGGTVSVHRLTQNWLEGTRNGGGTADGATWNSNGSQAWTAPGGSYDGTPVASKAVVPPSNQWVSWPIENLVDGWVNGDYPNLGLLLKGSGTFSAEFADKGATAADRPKLTVIYACECGKTCANTPVTITLNPVADTYVDTKNPAINYGSTSPLGLGGDTSKGDIFNGLLNFNVLASVPAYATINSAQLMLYETAKGSGGAAANNMFMNAYKLTKPWVEAQATANKASNTLNWTSVGGDYNPTLVSSAKIDNGGNVWDVWNLTPLVQEWLDGFSPDYGVILVREPGSGNPKSFHASRESATNKPKLEITYTAP